MTSLKLPVNQGLPLPSPYRFMVARTLRVPAWSKECWNFSTWARNTSLLIVDGSPLSASRSCRPAPGAGTTHS